MIRPTRLTRTGVKSFRNDASGNVLFIIFLAVALLGVLTVVVANTTDFQGANIDQETLAIRLSEIRQHASEVERAVAIILQNGYSETDIRFAHPDAPADYGTFSGAANFDANANQVFHRSGGGAGYRAPPAGISGASSYEFYGGTAAPSVGTTAPDLMLVLPDVSEAFCEAVNRATGQTAIPRDTGSGAAGAGTPGDCVYHGDAGRFDDTLQFYDTANTMEAADFAQDSVTGQPRPAPQGCVVCDSGEYHFYHVLLAR